MKLLASLSLLAVSGMVTARADLTIVQKIDGIKGAAQITVRIKGDKTRIDTSPQMTTIVDGRTGEVVTLMNDQKKVVRISADKMKAAAEMIQRFSDKKPSTTDAKPEATGRKDKVNGYEAEEYRVDRPLFKAAYWLAPQYPDGASILKQLQAVKSEVWKSAPTNGPDYRDFPALPIKTVVEMGNTKVTTTIVSVREDTLDEAKFAIPGDFQEFRLPDMHHILSPGKGAARDKTPPHP